MRYLKSVLFIVLVSVFAVQANANVLLPSSLTEVKVPNTIIEEIQEGRNVHVTNTTNESIILRLISAVNGEIYSTILSANNTITLSNLAPDEYKLVGIAASGSEIVSIIIE